MRVTDRGSRDVEAAPQLQLHAGIAAGDDEHEPSPLTFGAAELGQEADAAATAPSHAIIPLDLNITTFSSSPHSLSLFVQNFQSFTYL